MTLGMLKEFESEVQKLVNQTLDQVKAKSFSDYVLLLAYAGYQVELEGTFLSPYVIHSRLEILQDITRKKFLVTYLNNTIAMMQDNIFLDDDYKEYGINVQLMIYSHIWESHLTLKTLKRISDILNGKPYPWRIPFIDTDTKGKSKPRAKSKLIEDTILSGLEHTSPSVYKFIKSTYDSELRNSFSHSGYYIDIENNKIECQDSERYMSNKFVDLFDWEDKFYYSVLFSYHLSHTIHERLNSFTSDFPDITEVIVKWPSFKSPGVIHDLYIIPVLRDGKVEFTYKNLEQ